MPISGEQLMKLGFLMARCGCCGKPIDETEDKYAIEGSYVCGDCYFESFSEEIEKHPIFFPGRRMT
jgi:ribosome-binding protein aMBF1 (putative translation factor)